MQPFRQDLLPSQAGDRHHSHLLSQIGSLSAERAESSAGVLTADAVAPVEDSTELSPLAQSVADLQSLIERLNSATTALDVEESLLAVKDFVTDNTNAEMIGGSLGDLAQMADDVLGAIQNDPEVLGDSFALSFSAKFSQKIVSNDNFYSEKTSFSFSFSFQSENTAMKGSMSFDESLKLSDKGMHYQSNENVSVKMVTMNADLESNPVVDAFAKIAERLTGIDAFAALGVKEPEVETEAPLINVSEPYFPISPQELLQMHFEYLTIASNSHQRLMYHLNQLTGQGSQPAPEFDPELIVPPMPEAEAA